MVENTEVVKNGRRPQQHKEFIKYRRNFNEGIESIKRCEELE
jgi:hypothetical protein